MMIIKADINIEITTDDIRAAVADSIMANFGIKVAPSRVEFAWDHDEGKPEAFVSIDP
jgi:hypothetical protein